jgi:cytochrome c peroxidase
MRWGAGTGWTAALAAAALLLGTLSLARKAQSTPAAAREGDETHAPGASQTRARAEAASRDDLEAVGRAIFFDPSLSEPPGTSCAGCHDPAQAFAGNHGSTVGVALGSRPGHFARRNTPSVLYLRFVKRFHLRWEEDAALPDVAGGFFWDGRADSIVDAVRGPLLDPDEMNNGDAQSVAAKVRAAPYADALRRATGVDLADPDAALRAVGLAEQAFLLGDAMSPFSSRFDDFVRGQATLTQTEARGLALFRDHEKGGCDGCHRVHDNLPDPTRSLFTDYRYDSVGAPRNRAVPANRDPSRFDLGLCGRPIPALRGDVERFCGSFRTPSLRNVAVRQRFMHNGAFERLRDVVAFYATARTEPARWYPGGGAVDDVPPS